MIGEYTCLECEEKFENREQALIHHVYNSKHEKYCLINTDITMHVKPIVKQA